MFGHHFLILNLFYLLTFLSPEAPLAASEIPQTSFEVVITEGHPQNHAIIELISFQNQLQKTSQTFKLPFVFPPKEVQGALHISDVPKLLYFNIGDTIELGLTSTTIIFPFHCFT